MKRIAKHVLVFAAMLLILSVSVFASAKKTIKLKNNPTTVKATMTAGDRLNLTVKDGKNTVTNKAKYKTADKAIATVSKKGLVTAKKDGTTVITVTYKKKTAVLLLTVRKKSTEEPGTPSTTQDEHGEIKIRRVGSYGNYYSGRQKVDVPFPLISYKATEIVTKPHYYRVSLTVEATSLLGVDYVIVRLKDTVLGDVYEGRLTGDEVVALKHDNLIDIPVNAPVPAGEYDLFVDEETPVAE